VASLNGQRHSVAAGVVLASGYGSRFGAELNKVYLRLAGRRLVSWSLDALGHAAEVGVLVLVIRPQDRQYADQVIAEEIDRPGIGVDVEIVHGGGTRQESELMALRHLAERITAGLVDTVLIHDAARPLVSTELVDTVLRTAREYGGAIPGVPRDDLVVAGADGTLAGGGPLTDVVAVQTPQGFRAAPLLAAYEAAAAEEFAGTDTAACMARYSDVPVRCIAGEQRNFKVTYAHELVLAEQVLAGRQPG
jgi:2-C-methyl-D-erythritol 4-phosphate cytidylyltransferase